MSVHKGLNVTVTMYPAPVVYVKLFHPMSGPDRHLRAKTQNVASMARELAPKRTWWLANSIRADQNRDEKGRYTFGYGVVARTRYAAFVHEGTGPDRRGKFPGAMRFPGTGLHTGQIVFTNDVNHPGTPANPFLRNSLIALAL